MWPSDVVTELALGQLCSNKDVSWFGMQCLGVGLTAALVVSNKLVLEALPIPGSTAALVLLHNLCTLIYLRTMHACRHEAVKQVDWKWLLVVTGTGSFAVLMSNVVLKNGSVTFHQLSKFKLMNFVETTTFGNKSACRSS